jgi:hypothetical protein
MRCYTFDVVAAGAVALWKVRNSQIRSENKPGSGKKKNAASSSVRELTIRRAEKEGASDMLLEKSAKRIERTSGKTEDLTGRSSNEEAPMQRGAGRDSAAASETGNAPRKGEPEDGHLDPDVLAPKEAVRPAGHASRFEALEDENRKLKQRVANLGLDKRKLRNLSSKKPRNP